MKQILSRLRFHNYTVILVNKYKGWSDKEIRLSCYCSPHKRHVIMRIISLGIDKEQRKHLPCSLFEEGFSGFSYLMIMTDPRLDDVLTIK